MSNVDATRLRKLPKWAQKFISDLQRINVALNKEVKALSSDIPEKPERDLAPPEKSIDALSKGWDYNLHAFISGSSTSDPVYRAYSTAVSHGCGWEKVTYGSQGSRKLYSSHGLAKQALLHDFEQWVISKKTKVI